jgi:hypothetical protein
MTIAALFAWIGSKSAWWLLLLLFPAFIRGVVAGATGGDS